MALVEMPIVERESGVEALAARIAAILMHSGEISGLTVIDVLADATDAPRSDVRLALGRVPLQFLSNGNVRIQEA